MISGCKDKNKLHSLGNNKALSMRTSSNSRCICLDYLVETGRRNRCTHLLFKKFNYISSLVSTHKFKKHFLECFRTVHKFLQRNIVTFENVMSFYCFIVLEFVAWLCMLSLTLICLFSLVFVLTLRVKLVRNHKSFKQQ